MSLFVDCQLKSSSFVRLGCKYYDEQLSLNEYRLFNEKHLLRAWGGVQMGATLKLLL